MFEAFPKMGRLSKPVFVTEKIDGTNAQIMITSEKEAGLDPLDTFKIGETDYFMYAASRNRFISIGDDNYGFADWVQSNAEELRKLGPGRHYGEWWGSGIGPRRYPIEGRRFSLFNTARWGAHNPNTPSCCHVVPLLGSCSLDMVDSFMVLLKEEGSKACPGFMNPEGIVITHERVGYKKTFEHDKGKWTADKVAA